MHGDPTDPGVDPTHTISLIWEETGTADLCLSEEDGGLHTLYVVLRAGQPRIFGVDLTILFDLNAGEQMFANELDFAGGGERSDGAIGQSSAVPGLSLFRESNGISEGIVTDFDVVFADGVENATVTLGSIVFRVNPGALDNGIDILPSIDPRFDNGVFGLGGSELARRGFVRFEGASVKSVPEPGTALLLVAGMALLGGSRRRRR